MLRAVLEGVAFGLRDGLDLMVAAGMPAPTQVRASGGGIASPLWRQILADVLDTELATVSTTEGAAYGAALLATEAAGWFPSVEAAVEALVTATPVASPGPDAARYREAHAAYRELYPRCDRSSTAPDRALPPPGLTPGPGIVSRGARRCPSPSASPVPCPG
jgi:xylulokinase